MKWVDGLFGVTDEQAMWRVQAHDDGEAFGMLVARWQARITGLCARMLGDAHRAEDLTQEAFSRIYAHRKEFQHGSKFSTFLWRVATNLCLDELRRVKRRREIRVMGQTEDWDDSGGTEIWDQLATEERGPDGAAADGEQAELVRQAVQALPEHYRAVVILRHYQDLKFREIAEVLGVAEGTVKSRMFEALELLNRTLRKRLKTPRRTEENFKKRKEQLAI